MASLHRGRFVVVHLYLTFSVDPSVLFDRFLSLH